MKNKAVLNGSRSSVGRGHIAIFLPEHTRADPYGYVMEHIVVVEKAMGKPLPDGAVVHHFNERPADNRNENLVACQDQAYHILLHTRQRALAACGNADWRKCPYCKLYDSVENLRPHRRKKGPPFYYHLACGSAARRGKGYSRRARERRRIAAASEAGL